MRLAWTLLLTLLSSQLVRSSRPAKRHYSTHDYYVLEHDPVAGASLHQITNSLGVEVVEQVGELKHFWLLRTEKPDSTNGGSGVSTRDTTDRVLERFDILRTQATAPAEDGFLTHRSTDNNYQARNIVSSVKYLSRQYLRQRVKRAPPPPVEEESPADVVAHHFNITDPLFSEQWHIVNKEFPEHTMNVTGVWEMGITGKGVISALIDDGLDYESQDLAANFYAYGSHDFNDHTDLPTPQSLDDHHGTRCAGQIAAVRNNVCGIGLAYESRIAGIRILSGPVSDADEATALNYDYQNTSLYSCSWGPRDNGESMEGPNYVIEKAVVEGINNGRGGKGSIFVFASGNGAPHGDQCNFDGYTNSIYSVTVSAVDYKGLHPRYSEPCAANLIVAYSSGSGKHIVTTDVGVDKCSHYHSGTSAAAPNAAGVMVLALEVRPELTWRDIQHLCVTTARLISPEDPDWENTYAGRPYSYKYGYGAIDAFEYVTAAKTWQLVKPQTWFETDTIQIGDGTMDATGEMRGGELIPPGGLRSSITVTKEMLLENNFEALEHINVRVYIAHSRRGDVEVEIVSPNGIKSVLAAIRRNDAADTGFPGWTFMTVKHWGEDPIGEWSIRVSDQAQENEEGHFLGWTMTLWGSSIDPSNVKKYVVSLTDPVLPPHPNPPPATITPSATTRVHSKPTDFLSDHGSAPGENHKPAFPTKGPLPTSSALPSSTPTPDQGWFSDMTSLLSDRKWFFGAAGAVVVFALGAAAFFWRRRQARKARSAEYTSIPAGDYLPMSNFGSQGPRTRELYDAFGEVEDEEEDNAEDADEETGLRSGRHVSDRSAAPGLGFHSAFLEDDDPASARAPTPIYKDEPESEQLPAASEQKPRTEGEPPSPARSRDGSWEHAP